MAKIIRVWDGTQWQEVGTALPNALSTDGVQTLTNKTISGSNNTLTNIPNNALTNSAITINGSAISLGGSTTIAGGLAQPSEPSSPGDGQIWVDTDGSVVGQAMTRWSKVMSAGITSISGLDDSSVTLTYTSGYEQVYRNGVLLSRGNDYTATTGTSITLIDATLANDVIEVIGSSVLGIADVYTQTQSNAAYIGKALVDAKGDIITATADNTPTRLAVGANDTVLTADSSTDTGLKWSTPSSDFVLISRTTFSAVATRAFDNVFTSTYKSYQIVLENINSTTDNNADLQMQWRSGGVTSTSNYMNAASSISSSGTTLTNIGGYQVNQITLNKDSSAASHGIINAFNVGIGTARPTATWGPITSGETITNGFGHSTCHTAAAVDGFLLKASTGDITGTVAIYGRK